MVVEIDENELWLLVLARPPVIVACGELWQVHDDEVPQGGGGQ